MLEADAGSWNLAEFFDGHRLGVGRRFTMRIGMPGARVQEVM